MRNDEKEEELWKIVLKEIMRKIDEINPEERQSPNTRPGPGDHPIGEATNALKQLWSFREDSFKELKRLVSEHDSLDSGGGEPAEIAFKKRALSLKITTIESHIKIVETLLGLQMEGTFAETAGRPFSITQGWDVSWYGPVEVKVEGPSDSEDTSVPVTFLENGKPRIIH